ncbi:MAG: hypothetical protein JSS81_30285 [Acidobacteria bacterium]|nr:hypothetical protein [Acidobacteriota bacterium]
MFFVVFVDSQTGELTLNRFFYRPVSLHLKSFTDKVFNLPVKSHRRGGASAIADATDLARLRRFFPSITQLLLPSLLLRFQNV